MLPLSICIKISFFGIFFLLTSCATPLTQPSYMASGEILKSGNILRVWREDGSTRSPEKIQIIINSYRSNHPILEKINYRYRFGKLTNISAQQYKNNDESNIRIHLNESGQIVFKQSITNKIASLPSKEQLKKLMSQQQYFLDMSNQLEHKKLDLYQGTYHLGGSVVTCQHSKASYIPNSDTVNLIKQKIGNQSTIGIAWLVSSGLLPFNKTNTLLLLSDQDLCIQQPSWFVSSTSLASSSSSQLK